ncbi:hypothetical protein CCMA1212_004700 [Trichoderma ghanense]|uniref:Uncharacterized protein n=1 Tax=Trichoderma ghanense TaxID=65468 RepID=A0ABY2H7H4_9HYPO
MGYQPRRLGGYFARDVPDHLVTCAQSGYAKGPLAANKHDAPLRTKYSYYACQVAPWLKTDVGVKGSPVAARRAPGLSEHRPHMMKLILGQ